MANFGMMWVQSAENNLQADLTSIYEGVTGNAYKACNLAHSYQNFLDDNPNYGAIGLPKYDQSYRSDDELLHSKHVDMSCVLFRKEVLDKVDFVDPRRENINNPGFAGMCECTQCCFTIRQMGLEIGFLPGLHATHIENTRNI